MEFQLLPILTFLSLALVASHAALSPEDYWKSVLPNSPMPQAVKDSLNNEWMEDKSTSVGVGKGGVSVEAGKGKPGGTSVGVGKGGVTVGAGQGKPGGTNVGVGKGGVSVGVGQGKPGGGQGKPGGTNVGVGKGGVVVTTRPKGKPVYVGVTPGKVPFLYQYAATEDQTHDNPNVALFFLEKDLKEGTKMNLQFTKTTNAAATFLPRADAEKIPFSSEKIPEILDHFSVSPDSKVAEVMKKSIKECEEPGIKGEEKYCATSLESMVDFSTSKLGKNIHGISTEVEKENQVRQSYRVVALKKTGGDDAVVCHKQNYVYAVFYCHKTSTTKAYLVSMEGADGTKVNAVAVCHTDTSAWNPKHLAFQVLKVKPGTVPVCHFLPEDHVVWVQN